LIIKGKTRAKARDWVKKETQYSKKKLWARAEENAQLEKIGTEKHERGEGRRKRPECEQK